jgi:hypothetical protein
MIQASVTNGALDALDPYALCNVATAQEAAKAPHH